MTLQQLRDQRANLLREAEAFKGADGAFATDQARTAFDAKMTEIEAVDVKIRAAEAAAATPTPAPAPVSTEATRAAADAAVATERARVLGIQSACRTARLADTVAADMIGRSLTLDAARAEIFAQLETQQRANPTTQHIAIGEDARDKFARGVSNWLIIKGGAADMVARSQNVQPSTIDPGEFRGLSLLDLARHCLESAGRTVRGLDKMRLVGEALTLRGDITQSTSDFTYILENTMHKILQAAYGVQPDTWRRFCGVGTVSDFRAHNRYRMGSFASLDTKTENGEYKNKSIPDAEKATITAATKGNIINVSREMIVNDDMNAFTNLLTMLGRAAKLSIEVDVYALLAQNSGDGPTLGDSVAMFHTSSHGANKTTATALTAANLDTDRVQMAKQTDPSGNDYLDLRPAILLLPVAYGGQARIINQSQYDPDTIANKAQMKPNVVAGLFRDIVDTPRITGTRRYLFADPQIAPVIEVAFLEGQQEPVLETRDGWRQDGAEMRVRFDYAVGGVDYRGAVTNAGQA